MALKSSASSTDPVLQTIRKGRTVIASYWMGGNNIKCYDTTVVTVETYEGLSETAATTLAQSLESNTMADYNIRSSSSAGYSWIRCPSAKGTIVTADARRVGNSRMFTVEKVTETHTCSNSAGWEEYTP